MESTLYQDFPADLKVIETIGFTPVDGFARLALHIDRAERTCAMLGFPFDRAEILQTLGSGVGDEPVRCRLTIDAQGRCGVTVSQLVLMPDIWRLTVAQDRLQSSDPWLGIKTTNRARYDKDRANLPEGVDELIYLNERDEVCEGTITSVFALIDGALHTPQIHCGVLPGVLRQEMLADGRAIEAVLTMDDLCSASDIFAGNSLRGLIKAQFV